MWRYICVVFVVYTENIQYFLGGMQMKSRMNRKGFTLIEVIVVAAIIAILAGILVPMIFNQIDESKITKTKGDVKGMQTAFMMFRKDTGVWPVYSGLSTDIKNATYGHLNTLGTDPDKGTTTKWDTTSADGLATHMTNTAAAAVYVDSNGKTTWKGPYLQSDASDAWGRSYWMNVRDFKTVGAPVWIISGGPDGALCTEPDATEIAATCDDIGLRVQ